MEGHQKKLLSAMLVVAVFVGYFVFDLQRFFGLEQFQEKKASLQLILGEQPVLFIAVFAAVYAIIAASSLPLAAVMTIIAGALFGTLGAAAIVIPSATVGSLIPFLFARYLIHDTLKRKFKRTYSRIRRGIDDSGWWYLIAARLSAVVPFSALNIVSGVAHIPIRQYLTATFLGIIPGTLVFSYAGSQLGASTDAGTVLRPGVLVALLLIAIVPIIIRISQKWLINRKGQAHGKV